MEQDIFKTALETLAAGLTKMPAAFLYPTGGDSESDDPAAMPVTVYPSDSHIETEMLALVEGKALLLGTRRNYELVKGRLFVVTPGTLHAESFYSKYESYKILWIEVRANELFFFISSYNKGDVNFQTSSHKLFFDVVFARELWLRCSKGRSEVLDEREQKCVQAYALLAVCSVIESYEKGATLNRKEYGKLIVNQILAYIKHNYAHSFSNKDLAKLVRISPSYLNVLFKREMRKPIYTFILETRLEQAANLLKSTSMPIKDAAASSGFRDPLYFCRIFKKKYNLTPSRYRSGNKNK